MKPDFTTLTNQHRKEQWAAIAGGINQLFLEDLEINGSVSPSKFQKFKDNWVRLISDETADRKVRAVKEIRECFRVRDKLDHFLFISGIGYVLKIEPNNPDPEITMAVRNA